MALDRRRNAWRYCQESISYTSQANELSTIKAVHAEFEEVHSQVLQDILRRLDRDLNASLNILKRLHTGSVELYNNASGSQTSFAFCEESGKCG